MAVTIVAEGLDFPTALTFGDDGALYVGLNHSIYPTRPIGEVLRLLDSDGDGSADQRTLFAAGLDRPVGLAFHEGALYISQRGSVLRTRDSDGDGQADERTVILDNLPAYGLHHNNSLRFGPDGLLYLTLGSSTNNGPEPDPLNATILRAQPDGSGLERFASGLRNPFDFDFDASGHLFATDNGCDPSVCQDAPEELNHIVAGADYGFPRFVGEPPPGSGTQGPIATFPPHASANGMLVYQGDMFPEWRGDLFVALFGSYLAGFEDVGHRVLRVTLTPAGDTFEGEVHPFAEGFARPLDLVVAPDGALLVADFEAGSIYRLHRP